MQLRDHPAIVSKRDFYMVDPALLKIEPGFNVRDLEAPAAREALDELKESVREHWVQDPLEIRLVGEDLFISHGHRRHKVVMELIDEGMAMKSVPVVAEPKGLSAVERKARIHTLNANEPLSPLEKAELVRWLLNEGGCTREEVARHIGVKTLAMVDRYKDMSEMPEPVREAVREGEISATNAVEMVRREGPLLAEQTLTEAKTRAEEAGRKKVTSKSIVKHAATQRKYAETVAHAPEPSPEMGTIAKFDHAMMLLLQLIGAGRTPEQAASPCLIQAERVAEVGNWLLEVSDHLKRKKAA